MYTQVLKFGVRSLLDHSEEALTEMVEAHRYYNLLIEIGNAERKAYREIRSKHVPALDLAEKRLTELNEAIEKILEDVRLARKKASAPRDGGKARPTKLQATLEEKAELARLKAERKQVAAEAKALRAEFDAMIAPARKAFDARASGAPQDLLEAIDDAGKALKEAKRTKNNPDVPKLKARLQDLKDRKKKTAPATHKKRAVNADVFAEMLEEPQWHEAWKLSKAAEVKAKDERIKARAESGLTHGTYAAVELAVDQAFKEAEGDPWRKSIGHTGGRKIGRQISGRPLTGADLYAGNDSRLKLTKRGEVPLGRRDASKRTKRGAKSARNFREHVVIAFPIGKGDDRKWVSAQVHLHRPIPLDAKITWVYIVPKRVGFVTSYSLQLTVNTDRRLVDRPPGKGECHVRLRWSREPMSDKQARQRGIIVAEINGEPFAMDGKEYQDRCAKVTPLSKRKPGGRNRRGFNERGGAYAGMLYARNLKGVADAYFEGSDDAPEYGARRMLADWMKRNPKLVPKWMKERTGPKPSTDTSKARAGIQHWRKHGPLAVVAMRWMEAIPWTAQKTEALLAHEEDPESELPERYCKTQLQELWVAWKQYRAAQGLDFFTEDERFQIPLSRDNLNEWLATQGITSEFETMGIWLEWWRRKDKHLLQWAADSQRKALGNRKEQCRIKAAQLAAKYATCTVHALDLSELAKRKTPDRDEDELHRQARYQRFAACPSQFKEALQLAFGPERYSNAKRESSGDKETPAAARESSNGQETSTESLAQVKAAE